MRSFKLFTLGIATTTALGLGLAGAANADSAGDKAGRGLAAMTTGFLELPGHMVVETREHGAAYGVPVGFVKGLGGVVVRTVVGVYEFVTAPIPVPDDYRPILQPEYPWGYFDDGHVAVNDDDNGRVATTGMDSL